MRPAVEHLLLAGATGLAVAGFVIDLKFGWDAFPRSGALIVAASAAFAGREIFAMERAISRHEARVEKLEASYLDGASAEGKGASEERFSRLAKLLGDFRESRIERVGRIILVEISLLCAGTIIWGFGDLAVSFYRGAGLASPG